MPVRIVTHNHKRIIIFDLSGLKKTDDLLDALEEFKKVVLQSKNLGKIAILTDVTDASLSTEFMEKSKGYAQKYFNDIVYKRAIIGVTGVKKVLLMGYNSVVDNDTVKPFDSKREALDYLAAD